jgi:hypothetical protein
MKQPFSPSSATSFALTVFISQSERFIKIGITKNTVEHRYRGSKYNFDVIKLWNGPLYECYQKETMLKSMFSTNLYRNSKNLFITESFNIASKDEILKFL